MMFWGSASCPNCRFTAVEPQSVRSLGPLVNSKTAERWVLSSGGGALMGVAGSGRFRAFRTVGEGGPSLGHLVGFIPLRS